MSVRRVVTGNFGGKSKIVSDGGTRRSLVFKHIPGQTCGADLDDARGADNRE